MSFKLTTAQCEEIVRAIGKSPEDDDVLIPQFRVARNPKKKSTTTIDYLILNFGTEAVPEKDSAGNPVLDERGISKVVYKPNFKHIGAFFQKIFDLAGAGEPVEYSEKIAAVYTEDKVTKENGKEVTHKKGEPILDEKGAQVYSKVTRKKDRRWAVLARLGVDRLFEEASTLAKAKGEFDEEIFFTTLVSGQKDRAESLESIEKQMNDTRALLYAMMNELTDTINDNRAKGITPIVPANAAETLGLEGIEWKEPEDVTSFINVKRQVLRQLKATYDELESKMEEREAAKARKEAAAANK